MKMKLDFSPTDWVFSQLRFSDIVVALLGLFIFNCIVQKLTNKGDMTWPVMGMIPSCFSHVNKDMYDWVTRVLIKAGGTIPYRGMWMSGLHGIITVDPSKVEYMLKTRFINYPKGKYYRERFHDLLGNGIFNADGELWKEQRRLATSEMHASRFVEYSMQTIQDLVHHKLLKLIEKLVINSGDHCVDLQQVLLRFTFDNICTVAFGFDPGCLDPHLPQVPFADAFEEATELTTFRFLVPHFIWKPMKFFGIGFEKRLKEAIQIVHDFAEKMVTDRRIELSKQNGKVSERSDLLTRLIEIKNEGEKSHLSNDFLKDFCTSFILAGRDTSSVALAWFFWLIHKNPEVEFKIIYEINEILGHRKKEERNDIVFTMEEIKKMVYLEAALSESLRLYPPVPIEFKEALEDDVFPDGTMVKKGDRVLFFIFSMARMESIWGKDCEEFNPERWIKDEQIVNENQFKYVVFNGGPRLCLGKKFAYMQMKMIVASVLLRYSVKVVDGQDIVPKLNTTLYMKNGLFVTFKTRSSQKKKDTT